MNRTRTNIGQKTKGANKLQIGLSFRQIIAFTKRDIYSWATYKTSAVTQIINVFIGVFSWGIGASYVQKPVAQMYNTDYISFLLVGIAVGLLIMPIVQGINQLNPWTLETVLMTGVGTSVFIIGSIMWNLIFSVMAFIPYLLIGIYFFNVKLHIDILSTIVAFAISAAILMGLAMISNGIRIVTKSTDPITWVLNVLQNLLAGVSFPVIYLDTIFFPGFSTISWFIPQTWVYDLTRLAMLTDASLFNPATLIHFLLGSIFAIVLFPLGYKLFHWGVNQSKKNGTLGWY